MLKNLSSNFVKISQNQNERKKMKIAIIRLSAFGDVVISTKLLAGLKTLKWGGANAKLPSRVFHR